MSVQEKIQTIEGKISKDKTKEYNAMYYKKNKEAISIKLCEKVECNLCGRIMIKNNLNRHKTKPICLRVMERKIKEAELLEQMRGYKNMNLLGDEIK